MWEFASLVVFQPPSTACSTLRPSLQLHVCAISFGLTTSYGLEHPWHSEESPCLSLFSVFYYWFCLPRFHPINHQKGPQNHQKPAGTRTDYLQHPLIQSLGQFHLVVFLINLLLIPHTHPLFLSCTHIHHAWSPIRIFGGTNPQSEGGAIWNIITGRNREHMRFWCLRSVELSSLFRKRTLSLRLNIRKLWTKPRTNPRWVD